MSGGMQENLKYTSHIFNVLSLLDFIRESVKRGGNMYVTTLSHKLMSLASKQNGLQS
jgi:hypothetical protein